MSLAGYRACGKVGHLSEEVCKNLDMEASSESESISGSEKVEDDDYGHVVENDEKVDDIQEDGDQDWTRQSEMRGKRKRRE